MLPPLDSFIVLVEVDFVNSSLIVTNFACQILFNWSNSASRESSSRIATDKTSSLCFTGIATAYVKCLDRRLSISFPIADYPSRIFESSELQFTTANVHCLNTAHPS